MRLNRGSSQCDSSPAASPAGRRSPFAGLVVLLLGLLVTGGLYAALSPATAADQRAPTSDMVAKGRRCSSWAAPPATARTARASSPRSGSQYGPSLVGVGAAAVDFQVGTGRMPMAQPGAQALRKPPVYNHEEIEALGGVRRLARPRARRSPTESDYDADRRRQRGRSSAAASSSAPTARPATTSPAPAARCRAAGSPRASRASPRSTSTRRCSPARSRCRSSPTSVLTPEDKRDDHRLPEEASRRRPSYGGFALGSLGPVSEGLFAWLVGIGALVGFAVWIAANSTRSRVESSRFSLTPPPSSSSGWCGRRSRPRSRPARRCRRARRTGPRTPGRGRRGRSRRSSGVSSSVLR